MNLHCPLCSCLDTRKCHQDKRRGYFHCQKCDLIFVPSDQLVDLADEKARYDLHENESESEGYRQFLSQMASVVTSRIPKGSNGLDFGSGPNPVLAQMLIEAGYGMWIYDPFYANDLSAFGSEYDFITATEVFEHLREPKKELNRLWSCLKPGGMLGIMTQLHSGTDEFAGWYYKNDKTHIRFFSERTFEWVAECLNAEVEILGEGVVLLKKYYPSI